MKNSNKKKAYTDESKSMGRKVGFATEFIDITRKSALPEEAFIYTTEITAIKTSQKDTMLVIDNNRENHPILNQIYDIPAKIHNQGK